MISCPLLDDLKDRPEDRPEDRQTPGSARAAGVIMTEAGSGFQPLMAGNFGAIRTRWMTRAWAWPAIWGWQRGTFALTIAAAARTQPFPCRPAPPVL